MILITIQKFPWIYFAETVAILITEVLIGLYALKSINTTFDSFMILSLYPLSLFIVWFLELYGWN